MNQTWFRFYEELNDFLPKAKRNRQFAISFEGNPSVKDLIEANGVPHVEVDMILVNSESVDFTHKVFDGDRVSVYPVFESLDISGVQHLREAPLRETRFITDVHLGRLTKYLRMAGFDTFYDRNFDDNEIINLAVSDKRIILTRDKILLRNRKVTHGYWIRSTDPRGQLGEVIKRFDLYRSIKPFIRCLECNTLIVDVEKTSIEKQLSPKTKKYYDVFKTCPGCKRIYWEGSHFAKMKKFIDPYLQSNSDYGG